VLNALTNEVSAQSGKKLTENEVGKLNDTIGEVTDALNCSALKN
jgi:hypothetical protein